MTFKQFPLPPHVTQIPGEPLRFHVKSRSNPAVQYLVDLEECGFNGACGCHDFQMRKLPAMKIDREQGRPIRKRRCYHIKQALYYLAELVLRRVAGEMLKQNHKQ